MTLKAAKVKLQQIRALRALFLHGRPDQRGLEGVCGFMLTGKINAVED